MIGGEYKCEWILFSMLLSYVTIYLVALQPKKLMLSVIRTVKKIELQFKFIIY